MEIEEALVFIKPGNEEIADKVLEYLDHRLHGSFKKLVSVVSDIPKKIIEEHYDNIKELPWFEPTISAFIGKDINLMIYKGENIIYRIREIVGDTDPKKASSGTIRKMFSNDSLKYAKRENRYLNNVIHASENKEEAEREIKIWSSYVS